MAVYRTGRIPNVKRVVVEDDDGVVAEWSGKDVLSIGVKVIADIDNLPHPIYLAMGGCSIESPVDALTTVTYGRAEAPPYIPTLRGIDSESIIAAMEQAGYPVDSGLDDAIRKACRVVDSGGPFYDDDDDDDA